MKDIIQFIIQEYGEDFLKEILSTKPSEYQNFKIEQYLENKRTFERRENIKYNCENCKKLIFKPQDKLYLNLCGHCEKCYILYIEGKNINGDIK